jgi:predicted nucleic acid-binding protein
MIFVDTWAWIGLAVKKDQYHTRIQAQHEEFHKARITYVTTDHVAHFQQVGLAFRLVP